jgi:hypothetical protein
LEVAPRLRRKGLRRLPYCIRAQRAAATNYVHDLMGAATVTRLRFRCRRRERG